MGDPHSDLRGLTIGAAAAVVGTTARAIRLYEAQGLMPRPERERSNSYRRYHADDLDRLRFIKRAQGLGFSLAEVSELLALDTTDCDVVQELAQRHQALIGARIDELQRLREVLEQLLAGCARGSRGCPILHALIRTPDGASPAGAAKPGRQTRRRR